MFDGYLSMKPMMLEVLKTKSIIVILLESSIEIEA